MKSPLSLFFHSIDRDIEILEGMSASESILSRLRGMQDTVRSNWAAIYSNDKKEVLNTINAYLDLNVEVNEAYNYIVNERSNYLRDNKLEEGQPIDHFILDELFLSYTIFLDSYSQLGFYYVLCSCFPVHQMAYFVQNRQMREASLILGDRDE